MYNMRIAPRDHITLRCNEKQPRAVLCLLMQGLSQLLRQYDWLNLWYFILTLSYSSIKPHNTFCYVRNYSVLYLRLLLLHFENFNYSH